MLTRAATDGGIDGSAPTRAVAGIREIRPAGSERHEVVLDSGIRVKVTASYRHRLAERLDLSP